jgi:hypothetical protein
MGEFVSYRGGEVRLDRDELLEHVVEQREWLEASCAAFDAGVLSEAKRLAGVARTLLHSDGALLAQLGVRDTGNFADSVGDNSTALFAMGLVSFADNPDGSPGYGVTLSVGGERTPFDAWWNNVAIKTIDLGGWSRSQIVKHLANKDGGAHVDPRLPAAYRALTRENGMGWYTFSDSGEELPHPGNPIPWAMRKIAFELQVTLDEMFPSGSASP